MNRNQDAKLFQAIVRVGLVSAQTLCNCRGPLCQHGSGVLSPVETNLIRYTVELTGGMIGKAPRPTA